MFRSFRLANLLALAAVTLVLFATAPANAQKAALVKDVDAMGRTPYQQSIFFNQTSSVCTLFVCTVRFNAVPAGYRLVVTHVSTRYSLQTGGSGANVSIETNSTVLLLPAPVFTGFSSYIASSPVTFYVEAGQTPTVSMAGQFVVNNGSNTAYAAVVGYLIALN
jgi:hypothetical protein